MQGVFVCSRVLMSCQHSSIEIAAGTSTAVYLPRRHAVDRNRRVELPGRRGQDGIDIAAIDQPLVILFA